MNLYFVSSNEGKVIEAQSILGFPLKISKVDLDEIQDLDFEKVVTKKAQEAYKIIKKPVIVDDGGIAIDAFNNLPGPFTKFFLTSGGVEFILKLLKNEKNRNAYACGAIGFCDGKNTYTFLERVKGKIAEKAEGKSGMGWDSIFVPDGYKETYAEMGREKKNMISHRKKALEKLRNFLIKNRYV